MTRHVRYFQNNLHNTCMRAVHIEQAMLEKAVWPSYRNIWPHVSKFETILC